MSKKNLLSTVGGIAVLVLVVIVSGISFVFWKIDKYQKQISITTDKTEYGGADSLRVNIKNRLDQEICFSSCYPYYFEKKISGTAWKGYNYSDCGATNLVENCINPREVKNFEIVLPTLEILEKASYRLAIPVCIGCNVQEPFEEEQWSYSNEFNIQ